MTDESEFDQIDQNVVSGVYNRLDQQRPFICQLIAMLDIVVITFTPLVLLQGLDKLKGLCARPWFFGLGIAGLLLAVISLAMGLLFFGWTTIALIGFPDYFFGVKKKMLDEGKDKVTKDEMDRAVERNKPQWKLARSFFRLEVTFFLFAVLMIITGVFLLLAVVY